MSRVPPPSGYTTWNAYIEAQADASPDQSIAARRAIKKSIKESMIAAPQRHQDGRPDTYNSGAVSPTIGRPWS